jgi:hypothetical protein
MSRLKIRCQDCRTEGSKPLLIPTSDLEQENAVLKEELKQLKKDYEKLLAHARELLEIAKGLVPHKQAYNTLSLTEARLRLRGKQS